MAKGRRGSSDDEEELDDGVWTGIGRSIPGWLYLTGRFPDLFVQLHFDRTGTVVITAVVVLGDDLGVSDLRQVPLRLFQSWINSSMYRDWALPAHARRTDSPPLAKLFEGLNESHPLLPQAPIEEITGRPPRGPNSAIFYSRVARAYKAHSMRTNRPAAVIAEQAGVPVGTVRRWVHEARRLGFLEAGKPGRAR